MWKALVELYRQSWRYALACPVLFLVPVAAEGAQHVVEAAQGFYHGIAGARAAEASALRLAFGVVKIISILLTGYWMMRWLEWGQPQRVGALDPVAFRRFAPLLALEIVVELTGLLLIYGEKPAIGKILAATLVPMLIALMLADWRRSAPIGAGGGPGVSLRLILPILPWAFLFNIVAELPVLFAHYALGIAAVKGLALLKPVALVADTLVVGYLSAVVMGISWFVSEHARARHARLTLSDRDPSSSANSASAT